MKIIISGLLTFWIVILSRLYLKVIVFRFSIEINVIKISRWQILTAIRQKISNITITSMPGKSEWNRLLIQFPVEELDKLTCYKENRALQDLAIIYLNLRCLSFSQGFGSTIRIINWRVQNNNWKPILYVEDGI